MNVLKISHGLVGPVGWWFVDQKFSYVSFNPQPILSFYLLYPPHDPIHVTKLPRYTHSTHELTRLRSHRYNESTTKSKAAILLNIDG